MASAFHGSSLRSRLVLVGVGGIAVTVILLLVTGAMASRSFNKSAQEAVEELARQDLGHIASGVYNLIQAQDSSVRKTVEENARVARFVLDQAGRVGLAPTMVRWDAVDQFTKRSTSLQLPQLQVGSLPVAQVFDRRQPAPVVDQVRHLVDCSATLFERMNPEGDMLRVATTVLRDDGQRAVGTYIPVRNPDGAPNPVVASLLAGKSYRGTAKVVGNWYQTAYDPLLDTGGRVIGALYVGVRRENIDSLRSALAGTRIGTSGTVSILGGKGDQQGLVLFSKDTTVVGKSRWDERDARGQAYIQEVVKKALALGSGEQAVVHFDLAASRTGQVSTHLACITYFEPWDWVVLTEIPESDYAAFRERLERGQATMNATLAGIGLVVAVLFGAGMWAWASGLGDRLRHLAAVAQRLAVGDVESAARQVEAAAVVTGSEAGESADEMVLLAHSIRRMAESTEHQAHAAGRLSAGDLAVCFDVRSEQDVLSKNLNEVVDTLRALNAEMVRMGRAAVEGRLDTRADATRHRGGYREIVEGFNATLDALISPLHVAADCVGRIGRGEIPARLDEDWNGDFNSLKSSLNACIDGLGGLVEANTVLQRMAVNDYSRRIEGRYVGVFEEVKRAVNEVHDRVADVVRVLRNVSSGEFGELEALARLGRRSDQDEILPAVICTMENVSALVADVSLLTEAAVAGRISVRADAARHLGAYRRVVEGVNATLDAVIEPFEMAIEYVDQIGRGCIPPPVTARCPGDFARLKTSLDACIVGLGGLVEANVVLQRMAVNDYTRVFEGHYVGLFEEVKQAVGQVQARVRHVIRINQDISRGDLGELAELRKAGRRSDQDELLPSLVATMEALSHLTADVQCLSQAAVEGHLSVRADARAHLGQYRQIVEGINATLDALKAPIEEALGILERVAARDLTAHMRGQYRGDHERLAHAVNHATENLQEALRQVAMGAEQVSSASQEITHGSQDLAEGAGRQAAAIEEVSSSLHELSSMTAGNTDHAHEARKMSEEAQRACVVGRSTMGTLAESMEKIKTSSHSTAHIIKTIDEIAFQTNLLALNAAVEAARAGDAGRGFAVVADEVRNLAVRSAEAARNTSDLIQESVQNADAGAAINRDVLESFGAIESQVRRVSEVMAQIASASEQQSRGVEQINAAMGTLGATTQRVAASAEESASASEELAAQAAEMQVLVAAFHLEEKSARMRNA